MTPDEQMHRWCAGESVHNDTRDECCPDFSCCRPDLAWPMADRELFRDREDLRSEMMMGALGQLLEGQDVHIAGEDPTQH